MINLVTLLSTLFSINFLPPNKGFELAKSTKRNYMIYYHTSWCGWCIKMDRTVFPDTTLSKIFDSSLVAIVVDCDSKDTVTVKSNRITYSQLCSYTGVHSYPMFKYFTYRGKYLGGISGYVNSNVFTTESMKYERN